MLLDRRRGDGALPLLRVAARAARPDPAERLLGARKPPLIALLSAILLAGCGGAGHSPCSARIRAALAASSKAVAADGPAICDYRGAATAVRVTVDTHPQAYRRWSNTEVELGQNTAGWHHIPGGEPHPLDGVGIGAYWVPAQRTLSATDGARLVTVRVTSGRDPLRLATAAARLSLGRPQPPPASGP